MQKKLVNVKREALRKMEPRALVDHICSYPNQDFLNFDENEKRRFPIGAMAHSIKDDNYKMSDAQYYTLVHHFAKITVPDVKVVGITFYDNNPKDFAHTKLSDDGRGHTLWDMDFVLTPEPDNEYDKNAVRVSVKDTMDENGVQQYHHIGYLPADFVSVHPIGQEMEVHGTMKDSSNQKFKNVSYLMALDLEALNDINRQALNETIEQFTQLQLDLDIPEGLDLSDDDLKDLVAEEGLEQ